jgi:hypothetical protein
MLAERRVYVTMARNRRPIDQRRVVLMKRQRWQQLDTAAAK